MSKRGHSWVKTVAYSAMFSGRSDRSSEQIWFWEAEDDTRSCSHASQPGKRKRFLNLDNACLLQIVVDSSYYWLILIVQLIITIYLHVSAYNIDLSSQLKTARQQAEVSRQELTEYKEKAARILQVQCCAVHLYFLGVKNLGNIIRCQHALSSKRKYCSWNHICPYSFHFYWKWHFCHVTVLRLAGSIADEKSTSTFSSLDV